MPVDQIVERVRRVLLLDPAVFEEIRDDKSFTPVAVGLAAIAVILGAFGAWLWGQVNLDLRGDNFFVDTVILGSIFLVLLWLAGIGVAYVLLTQVFKESGVTPDGLVRLMAVGHIPFALSLLMFIPEIGFAFAALAILAMFFYTIFGIRAAYAGSAPFGTMLSVAGGFAVWLAIIPLLTSINNPYAPGIFIYEWTEDFTREALRDHGDFDFDFDFDDIFNDFDDFDDMNGE